MLPPVTEIMALRDRAVELHSMLQGAGKSPAPVPKNTSSLGQFHKELRGYIDSSETTRNKAAAAVILPEPAAKAAMGTDAANLCEFQRLCITGLTRSARRFWEANEQSLHASGASLEDIANATATEHDKQICRDATYIEYTRLLQTDPSAAGIFRALNATALDALL